MGRRWVRHLSNGNQQVLHIKVFCFVLFCEQPDSWTFTSAEGQRRKQSYGESSCVLVSSSQELWKPPYFLRGEGKLPGWDLPVGGYLWAEDPSLQLLLPLATYAFSLTILTIGSTPSGISVLARGENSWVFQQQGKAISALWGLPLHLSSLASRKEKLPITNISWARQPQVSSPIMT